MKTTKTAEEILESLLKEEFESELGMVGQWAYDMEDGDTLVIRVRIGDLKEAMRFLAERRKEMVACARR